MSPNKTFINNMFSYLNAIFVCSIGCSYFVFKENKILIQYAFYK